MGSAPAIAALRSAVWLGAAFWLAYLRSDGHIMSVRTDAIGVSSAALLIAGLALHTWSNIALMRGEREAEADPMRLATSGPFQYVRNPIYLAGAPILIGTYFLYPGAKAVDLVGALVV